MSEYQYYEFLAVDRPLDASALSSLRAMSTRAHITATSFINTYQWGDLKGDPRKLTERYFDAFLYTANWGTRRLMFRLPARLLDLDTAQQYCSTDLAQAWEHGENVIVELWRDDEDGGGDWEDEDEDGEGRLTSIIPVRAELAGGDLRLLYLGWLLSVQAGVIEDDALEPPVPPNLRMLEGPLSSVVDFLKIDSDLVAVASEASEDVKATAVSQRKLATWVARLSSAEKDALLLRVLNGQDAQLRTELLRRFAGQAAARPEAQKPRRSAVELVESAQLLRQERERLAAQRSAHQRQQRERAAAIAREKRLDELAGEGERAWLRVTTLIETMKPREYDLAVELLRDLSGLAQREDTAPDFIDRITALRQKYRNRSALLRRFDAAGLSTLLPRPSP
jgi:hypothetical protein